MTGIGPDGYETSGFMKAVAEAMESERPTPEEIREDCRRLLRDIRGSLARLPTTETVEDLDALTELIQLGFAGRGPTDGGDAPAR